MVDIVELILDEDAVLNGIDAISIVEHPAIESDFVALKDQQQQVKLILCQKYTHFTIMITRHLI